MLVTSVILDVYNYFKKSKKSKLAFFSLYLYAIGIGGSILIPFSFLEQDNKTLYYSICLTALCMTSATFFVFSIFALLTQKRAYVYVGSIITSLVIATIGIFVWNVMSIMLLSQKKNVYIVKI